MKRALDESHHEAGGAFAELVEVGPRDGLQNEAELLDTATKVDLVERLVGEPPEWQTVAFGPRDRS